ncbi:MAG: hypothetical protein QW041_02780 [Candidatus Pacearchaeota archaeon]
MKIKILFIIVLLLISIQFMQFTAAKIILPEFNKVYSIGDSIDSSFEIIEEQEVVGMIKLEIDCGEKILFYTSPISLKTNEVKKVEVFPYVLTKKGECNIKATLDGQNNFSDSATSKTFLVSDELNISLKINKENFKPEDILKIKGEIRRANGEYVDGTALVKLNNEVYSIIVKKGYFEFENTLSKNFPSGKNNIEIEAKDNFGNSGNFIKSINVVSIPTSLEIIANNNEFFPGDVLETYAVLYDQGGKKINTSISLILYDSWGIDVIKKMINDSEEILKYEFDKKSPTGEWWIYAYSEGIRTRRFIILKEQSKISAILSENMLTIVNLGNTLFKKPVEILFQNEKTNWTEIKEMNLGIEIQKKFQLNAPEGLYNITVKTDDFEKTFNDVYLTGNVIVVEDIDNRTTRIVRNVTAVVIIIAIISIILAVKINIRKKKPILIERSYNPITKKFKEKI